MSFCSKYFFFFSLGSLIMLRATKILSVCIFLALAFANVGQAQAQATYELGPFLAIGDGETPTEAEANAYGDAWDIVAAIAAVLPEGHEIIDFVVESEALFGTTFFLEFHLVVEYDSNGGGGEEVGGPGA
jgi:hypothetical protein